MATRNLSTRLTIDGAEEYKRQLKEISSGMSVLKSEMNKVSAEYANNSKSVDALNAKNDVLERQIITQKEKIETLREALQKSAETYGESDKKTQDWQIQLNNAEAQLAKMNNELESNKTAMTQSGDAANDAMKQFEQFATSNKKLSDVLGDVASSVGIKIPNGVKKALDAFVQMSPTTLLAVSGIGALTVALTKAEQKLMDVTKKSAARYDEFVTESMKSGLSVSLLQELDYASELIDVNVDTITGSLTKLTSSMSKAKNGNESTAEAFKKLGIEVVNANGELKSNMEVFYDVIDSLGEMTNDTERDALAMEILGKSAQDLNPLIWQGSEGLKKYTAEAEENAAMLEGDSLQALLDLDDAQQRLLTTQQAVADQISAEYAPYMEEALTKTRDCIKQIGDALVDSGVVDAMGTLLITFTDMVTPISNLTTDVLPAFAEVIKGIAGTIAWIADTINAGIGFFTYLFDGGERWNTAMGQNAYQASNIQKVLYGSDYKTEDWYVKNGYWMPGDNSYAYNNSIDAHASGTDNFRGGLTWVGENGPELVNLPRGSAINTAQESRNMGGDIFNITISANNVKEFNDIVNMAQNQRRIARMGAC